MTFYLTGSVPPAARGLLDSGAIGFMSSPNIGNKIQPGWVWAADNGCFSNYPGDLRWFSWLADNADKAAACLFAVAPDVVGDHAATLKRATPWMPRIRALGYPVAFVAQNGATVDNVPWGAFDVLFIGGDTAWKVGLEAQNLTFHAKGIGKRVHMGRVNSHKRLRHASAMGCDTADGTFLAFGPDVNVLRLLSWIERLGASPFIPLAPRDDLAPSNDPFTPLAPARWVRAMRKIGEVSEWFNSLESNPNFPPYRSEHLT